MPRRKLIRTTLFPYHVTARCNNQAPFPIALPKVWEIFEEELFAANLIAGFEPHAFTLMPNHFHLLGSTPRDDLGEVMRRFMASVTRSINLTSGRSGHVFGGPYHWTLVDNPTYYNTVVKYVYRNPVRAKLTDRVEDYEFSTLREVLGARRLLVPLRHSMFDLDRARLVQNHGAILDWLNVAFNSEALDLLRKGMRRRRFKLPKEVGSVEHLLELLRAPEIKQVDEKQEALGMRLLMRAALG